MRYPWVCLAICGVWAATLIVVPFRIVDPTVIYVYTSATAIILFLLGFARS